MILVSLRLKSCVLIKSNFHRRHLSISWSSSGHGKASLLPWLVGYAFIFVLVMEAMLPLSLHYMGGPLNCLHLNLVISVNVTLKLCSTPYY